MKTKDAAVIGVVHQAFGEPAAGATVYLDSYSEPLGAAQDLGMRTLRPHKPHSTTTDALGRFVFRVSKELREIVDDDRIKVWAEQDGLVAPKVLLRCEAIPTIAGTLTLGLSLQPRVRLIDPDGEPVPGTHVDMFLMVKDESGSSADELHYWLRAFSDEHGLAVLPRVPDRRDWTAWLEVNPKDMPHRVVMGLRTREVRSATPIEVRLARGCTVRGRVELPDGSPGREAEISSRSDSDPNPNRGHSTTAAGDGTFELLGVPAGNAVLSLVETTEQRGGSPFAPPRGGARLTLRIDGKEGEVVNLGTVRLRAPMSISGRVLDRDGKPAVWGHVMLDGLGSAHAIGRDGRFEIGGVEPGIHALEATTYESEPSFEDPFSGELVCTVPDVPAGSKNVVIRVTGGGNLIVKFHPLGRPSQSLKVWSPSLYWKRYGGGPVAKCSEIRATIGPGRHTDISVAAEGYKTKALGPLEIFDDRPTVVDVELEPADKTNRGK